jgi:hypothetical protein
VLLAEGDRPVALQAGRVRLRIGGVPGRSTVIAVRALLCLRESLGAGWTPTSPGFDLYPGAQTRSGLSNPSFSIGHLKTFANLWRLVLLGWIFPCSHLQYAESDLRVE